MQQQVADDPEQQGNGRSALPRRRCFRQARLGARSPVGDTAFGNRPLGEAEGGALGEQAVAATQRNLQQGGRRQVSDRTQGAARPLQAPGRRTFRQFRPRR